MKDNAEFEVLAIIVMSIFFVMIFVLAIAIPLFTQDYITLKVTGKESYTSTSCDTDSNGYPSCSTTIHKLLYTDGEILSVDDCIILWVWGSQTTYSHIEENKIYRFKVYGYNIPWLNMYRSVISYEIINGGNNNESNN